MNTSPELCLREEENGSVSLVDRKETVWAEIAQCDDGCTFTLHNDKIPDVYCEYRYRSTYTSHILCEDDVACTQCKDALASLVHSGYKKDWNWLMSMDMGDLADYFGRYELGYLHGECSLGNILTAIKKMKKRLPKGKAVFVYVRSARENYYTLCETLWDDFQYYLIQYAWDNDMQGTAMIEVWYRDEK